MRFLTKNFPLLFHLINSQNMTFHIPFKFTNVDRPILSTLLRTNDQWQTSFDLLSIAGWAYCVLALLLKMSEFKRIPICTFLPFGPLSWCDLEYTGVLPESDWSTCSTWDTQTYNYLFVMATTLFYSMAHTANKSDFSFFLSQTPSWSVVGFLGVTQTFNYLLYNRRPRFLSMWVWVCFRASVYVQVRFGLKVKCA